MTAQFGKFDAEAFLRDTWQQRPALIRNPWTAWRNPVEPDELAGLACEMDVESRLVVRTGDSWSLEYGPIREARFANLGDAGWTLLVQAVDHHLPEVAALIEPFRFVPNWRIDDVMVSYAADGGGAGPHFDQYDVFLVQGLGRRRWQVGAACDASTPLLAHEELRLLERFEPIEEWVLGPGDILYVPPRVAHSGVALGGECMTYSIGFRAPSRRELIAAWCDEVLADLPDDDRYGDAGLAAQDNPGEISAQAIAQLHAMVTDKLLDRAAFARAFGKHASMPRYPDIDWRPDQPIALSDLRASRRGGMTLSRNPASRFSFVAESPDTLLLFVDGQCLECRGDAMALAERICAGDHVVIDRAASDAALAIVRVLYNQGSIAIDA